MNNKISKLLLICLGVILLTGCSIDYNLVITDKKKVIEESIVLDDNVNILKYNDSISDFLNIQKKGIEESGYSAEFMFGDVESGLRIKNNYSSLDKFVDNGYFKIMFEKANINEYENLFTFETAGEYYRNEVFSVDLSKQYLYDLDEIRINIQFYNVVDSHNADEVNEDDNIYTWILKSDDVYRNISFKLTNKVRTDLKINDFFSKNIKLFLIVSGIIVVVVLVILNLKRIIKNNNKI